MTRATEPARNLPVRSAQVLGLPVWSHGCQLGTPSSAHTQVCLYQDSFTELELFSLFIITCALPLSIRILLCFEEALATEDQPPGVEPEPSSLAFPLLSAESWLCTVPSSFLFMQRLQDSAGTGHLLRTASETDSSGAWSVSCCLIYTEGRIKFL